MGKLLQTACCIGSDGLRGALATERLFSALTTE